MRPGGFPVAATPENNSAIRVDPLQCMHYSASVVSNQGTVECIAAGFQALSEPTRLRIVALLGRAGGDLCVCEFVDALEEPQYHVSRSLRILQKAGWVAERREGKWVHYGLPTGLDPFRKMVLKAIAGIPEGVLEKDHRELNRRLKLRENGKCLMGVQKAHLLSRHTGGVKS